MQTLTDQAQPEQVFDLKKQAQIPLGSTETIDGICRGEVLVIQRRSGYRFAVDAMLLASFAGAPKGRVADLGTGCGIVSLILASRGVRPITAVEVQPPLASLAMRNVALNRRGEDVEVVGADLRDLKGKVPGSWFDLVVSNPPYVPLQAGHVNPGSERAIARHEVSCTPKDVASAARFLLKDSGSLKVIFPAPRVVELMQACCEVGLEPRRMRMVHPVPTRPAKLVLFEAVKGKRGSLEILPPLHLFDAAGGRSQELVEILGDDAVDVARDLDSVSGP
ncbi:MAG TPA: methyltransferase [Myxococcales bacterium]|jgi:tRNA1(Val) A37 N6-methylase TrmN6